MRRGDGRAAAQRMQGCQDNGRDTDDKVDLHSATYSVSVHEATTGKEPVPRSCRAATIVSFENGSRTKVYNTPLSKDDPVAFLKPFLQP
jgi:hypothetical protein